MKKLSFWRLEFDKIVIKRKFLGIIIGVFEIENEWDWSGIWKLLGGFENVFCYGTPNTEQRIDFEI